MIISAGDSSYSHEHLAMLTTVFPAAQRSRLRTPCDVLGHVRRHAAPAMGSPFGAHLRDLCCAAHTIINASRRSRSYVPLGGHVPCSSFDDHVMLAFTVPASTFVFRRSHPHPRSGFNVVRSCERPSSIPLRVHTLPCSLRSKQSALTFSCSCPRSSFDAHGRTHSVGSQSTGSRVRFTFRQREAPILFRFEDRRSMLHPSIALMLALRRSRSRCRTDFFEHNTPCGMLHLMKPSRAFA
jgi:hypothetical protein